MQGGRCSYSASPPLPSTLECNWIWYVNEYANTMKFEYKHMQGYIVDIFLHIMTEELFIARTTFGTFRVSIKPDTTIDRDTRQVITIGYIIRVGGKVPDCVFLKIPIDGTEGSFTRLESKEGCSLDPPYTVGGEKTIAMAKLAMTIAKEKNPKLQVLKLQDSASFPCLLPNGKYYQVNSTDYDLFFYQQSYYEKRFGAILVNPIMRKLYQESKINFDNLDKKPYSFDFLETKLTEQLLPLYNDTKTWKEFANEVSTKWKDNKCTIIYIWLKSALSVIFDSVSFAGQDWQIHLGSEHYIPYKKIQGQSGGKYTRKTRKNMQIKIHQYPSPSEYLAMNWSIKPNDKLGDGH
jgi:hypothetical protein